MTPLGLGLPVPVDEIADLEQFVRGLGFLTPDQAARLDAIARATWVLVKMDQGEYWRCGRCGGIHSVPDVGPVLTRFCVPRPFHGIGQGLYAYSRHLGARAADLTPAQRARANALTAALPELGTGHPQAAARLGTASRDLEIVGWLIGSVVEIGEADARRYAARINVRAHRPIVTIEEMTMPDDDQPHIYLVGGTDELWLDEAGRSFHPGDRMPRTLTAAKRASLQMAGIRFETRHPVPEPEPKDSDAAAEADARPPSDEDVDAVDVPALEGHVESRPRRAAKE